MDEIRLFVSHSQNDAPFCRIYVNALRLHGIHVWYDEQDLGSGVLRSVIERELANCQHFVVILSPSAIISDWVNAEIDAALELAREGKLTSFIPILSAPCEVPYLLRRYKRIEAPRGKPVSVENAITQTLDILSVNEGRIALPPIRPPHTAPNVAQDKVFVQQNINGIQVIIPPVVSIPQGEFLMGSQRSDDLLAFDTELPQHEVFVGNFKIGLYPITVKEYEHAVRVKAVRIPVDKDGVTWQTQLQHLDHPVVNVSWNDVVAYSHWLSLMTGSPWRLPTEAEWEKAARGTDGRIFSWGNEYEPDHANVLAEKRGTTTSVGLFGERGASPYGAQDMIGNVWEWTASPYQPYPYNDADMKLKPLYNRVSRGGSWSSATVYIRAAFRWGNPPDVVGIDLGFRLAQGSN